MVKKRVGGAHRYRAAAAAAAGEGEQAQQQHDQQQQKQDQQQQQQQQPRPPAHLQRKISRKAKFLEKVAASGASGALTVRAGVRKRKRKAGAAPLPDLQSLAGELEQLAAGGGGPAQPRQQQAAGKGTRSSIKRSKARLAVGVRESQRLAQVLTHPAFKADPVQAITNHLRSTLPAPKEQPRQPPPKQQGAGKRGSKGKKTGGVAAMQA